MNSFDSILSIGLYNPLKGKNKLFRVGALNL